MKDIHEVLRRKQAQYTLLGKQIEMLQQAAEKLREVAPLLAETDTEDDSAVLAEVDEGVVEFCIEQFALEKVVGAVGLAHFVDDLFKRAQHGGACFVRR